jgi:Raf kinase inhibitor-like YbhB/YbcL family protein
MKNFLAIFLSIVVVSCHQSHALSIKSTDIAAGSKWPRKHIFDSFGCTGKNISPQIAWSDLPEGTKSLAFTIYDPDAPTGSGWWHWLVVNIPITYKELPTNFGAQDNFKLADGILQIRNDFGFNKFGGSCPPKGDKPHKYIFTIYALKTDKIDLESTATAAFAGYSINQNVIAKASFEAFNSR